MTDSTKKVLYFEGAGAVPRGEMGNCRIRTAFKNDAGQRIYLEVLGFVRKGHRWCEKNTPDAWKFVGYVDHAYFITDGEDDVCNENRCKCERDSCFEYTHEALLKFVNSEFNCSFDAVFVTGELDGYHVFPSTRGPKDYNYGDEFVYSDEMTCHALSIRRHILQKDVCKASIWREGDILNVRYCSGEKSGQHWVYLLDQPYWNDGILLNP